MSERYEGNVRLVRVAPSGGYGYERIALETDEHLVWIAADGYPATTTRGHIGDRRPLVVIDPEDRDGARRLLETYGNQFTDWTPELDANVTRLQDALREYAGPTPEEPPVWTAVRVHHSGSSLVDAPYVPFSKWVRADEDEVDASWFRLTGSRKYAESRTWTEVLALCDPGTLPEVLRPEAAS